MKKLALIVMMAAGFILNGQEATSEWQVATFVDEFGDDTGETYLTLINYIITGTFSNSATIEGDLYVGVVITSENLYITLSEGRYPVSVYSHERLTMKVKAGEVKKEYKVNIYSRSIYIEDRESFIADLKAGDLKCYLSGFKYSNSVYRFTIPKLDISTPN